MVFSGKTSGGQFHFLTNGSNDQLDFLIGFLQHWDAVDLHNLVALVDVKILNEASGENVRNHASVATKTARNLAVDKPESESILSESKLLFKHSKSTIFPEEQENFFWPVYQYFFSSFLRRR